MSRTAPVHMHSLTVTPQLTVICFRRPAAARLGPLFVVREWDAKVIRQARTVKGHAKPKGPSTEQALRASVRQAILNMNLNLEAANKSEIQYLKSVGILGKRAPSCSLLYARDLLRLLYCFDKRKHAEELKLALDDESNFSAEDDPGLLLPRVQLKAHAHPPPRPVELHAAPKERVEVDAYPRRQVPLLISKPMAAAVAKAIRANGGVAKRLLCASPAQEGHNAQATTVRLSAVLPPAPSARKRKSAAASKNVSAGLDALLSVLAGPAKQEPDAEAGPMHHEDGGEDDHGLYGGEQLVQYQTHEGEGYSESYSVAPAPKRTRKHEIAHAHAHADALAAAASAAAAAATASLPHFMFQSPSSIAAAAAAASHALASTDSVHRAMPVEQLRGHGVVLPSALVLPSSPSFADSAAGAGGLYQQQQHSAPNHSPSPSHHRHPSLMSPLSSLSPSSASVIGVSPFLPGTVPGLSSSPCASPTPLPLSMSMPMGAPLALPGGIAAATAAAAAAGGGVSPSDLIHSLRAQMGAQQEQARQMALMFAHKANEAAASLTSPAVAAAAIASAAAAASAAGGEGPSSTSDPSASSHGFPHAHMRLPSYSALHSSYLSQSAALAAAAAAAAATATPSGSPSPVPSASDASSPKSGRPSHPGLSPVAVPGLSRSSSSQVEESDNSTAASPDHSPSSSLAHHPHSITIPHEEAGGAGTGGVDGSLAAAAAAASAPDGPMSPLMQQLLLSSRRPHAHGAFSPSPAPTPNPADAAAAAATVAVLQGKEQQAQQSHPQAPQSASDVAQQTPFSMPFPLHFAAAGCDVSIQQF